MQLQYKPHEYGQRLVNGTRPQAECRLQWADHASGVYTVIARLRVAINDLYHDKTAKFHLIASSTVSKF